LLSTKRPGPNGLDNLDNESSRTPFERDYDRVIFSFDFRRMQGKTQVLPFAESDFIHDRLTHSLETASIGRSLGKLVGDWLIDHGKLVNIKLNDKDITSNDVSTIVSTACLAHDIGNPPFGHNGERAIKAFFNFQGDQNINTYLQSKDNNELEKQKINDLQLFDGNPQGFRILARESGLKLTCATLGAYLKYPWHSLAHKKGKFGYFASDKDLFITVATELGLPKVNENEDKYCRHPLSLLVEAADDIAYRIIDLEDSISLDFIRLHEKIHDIVKDRPILKSNELLKGDEFENLTVEGCLIRISGIEFNKDKYSQYNNKMSKYAYLRAKAISNLINIICNLFVANYDLIMAGNLCNPPSLLDKIDLNKEMTIIQDISFVREYKNAAAIQIELSGHDVLGTLIKFLLDSYIFPNQEGVYKNSFKELIHDLFNIKVDDKDDKYKIIMQVIDKVSGMTDAYALSCYQKIRGIKLPQVY